MINNQEIHSARKSFSQSRIARLLTDIFPKWGRPADKLTPVSKVPRKPLRHMGFMLEPLEPRLLLSADISYTYSVADIAKFNDGDAVNNEYRLLIEGTAGADVLKLLAEDGSVLDSEALANRRLRRNGCIHVVPRRHRGAD